MLVSDRDAVEGMPVQLMIIAIVLAITVPMMFGALRTYDRSRLDQEISSEIDKFIAQAQLVYSAGPGNSQVIEFNAAGGSFSDLEYVDFGDVPGGNFSAVIRYKITSQAENIRLIQSPNVPMMSSGNETFRLVQGSYRLKILCQTCQIDLNNDSLIPDNFIQISLVE